MKIIKLLLIGVCSTCVALSLQAQGTFQNLNFEAANPSGYMPNSINVPITALLPGWTGYFGATQLSQVWYDRISIGAGGISVIDANSPLGPSGPIQGNYSVYLFGGGGTVPDSTTISQTATVPSGAIALTCDAYEYGPSFVVTLGGQTINMAPLQVLANYTVYGGDIPPSLAGQLETLSFTEPPATTTPEPSMLELDDISFSTQAVPEPNTVELLLTAATMLGLRRWRKRAS